MNCNLSFKGYCLIGCGITLLSIIIGVVVFLFKSGHIQFGSSVGDINAQESVVDTNFSLVNMEMNGTEHSDCNIGFILLASACVIMFLAILVKNVCHPKLKKHKAISAAKKAEKELEAQKAAAEKSELLEMISTLKTAVDENKQVINKTNKDLMHVRSMQTGV